MIFGGSAQRGKRFTGIVLQCVFQRSLAVIVGFLKLLGKLLARAWGVADCSINKRRFPLVVYHVALFVQEGNALDGVVLGCLH